MTTLTCPKCTMDMRSYERNRVLVDQCTGCGGLFLDRGELEKLVTAENEWHAAPGAPAATVAAPVPQDRPLDHGYREPSYDDRRRDSGYDRRDDRGYDRGDGRRYDGRYDGRGYDGHDKRRKKKSFLSELFDD